MTKYRSMVEPYPIDLRRNIIKAKLQTQESDAKIAARFGVSRSFVNKLVRQFRQTGYFGALPHGGGASPKLTLEDIELLIQSIQENPDLKLKELQQILRENTDKIVSIATLSRFFKKLKNNGIC